MNTVRVLLVVASFGVGCHTTVPDFNPLEVDYELVVEEGDLDGCPLAEALADPGISFPENLPYEEVADPGWVEGQMEFLGAELTVEMYPPIEDWSIPRILPADPDAWYETAGVSWRLQSIEINNRRNCGWCFDGLRLWLEDPDECRGLLEYEARER